MYRHKDKVSVYGECAVSSLCPVYFSSLVTPPFPSTTLTVPSHQPTHPVDQWSCIRSGTVVKQCSPQLLRMPSPFTVIHWIYYWQTTKLVTDHDGLPAHKSIIQEPTRPNTGNHWQNGLMLIKQTESKREFTVLQSPSTHHCTDATSQFSDAVWHFLAFCTNLWTTKKC